ncbi:helix-turn-helix transcriptional regulator [Corynebacterium hindlerae]|uniref:Helix-turn-helix transcriptional regulator n=1 Tax=Corynebacterium hindlerae TaxID=699041 RepID=A0A7G5FGU4_9CORY|nr:helix-turn-helix transcriptional regulator [Corynebacterium hindlerae]QMV85835.1 helix-turn-helix transcriptional regulator [Corynebacterium hindlerae]
MAGGRRPAKNFAAEYPGWPDIKAAEVDDVDDRRLLIFVHRLRAAVRDFEDRGWLTSHRDLARRIGTGHATILRVLRGDMWPTAETISKLETTLERELWPRQISGAPDTRPNSLDRFL